MDGNQRRKGLSRGIPSGQTGTFAPDLKAFFPYRCVWTGERKRLGLDAEKGRLGRKAVTETSSRRRKG